MSQGYDASDIEVLTGLEPVRKRPGMYTDTARPNHLALEVIDNGVDEAIAGFASRLDVTLHKDGSLSVTDDGRGMPVDIHPKEKISGVELILTRLHAGGKFSDKNYRFAGGLHGVGVSVVNALSKNLEIWIKRGGREYNMAFAGGKKKSDLEAVGTVGKRNTGTTIRFWPNPRYFDSSSTRSAPRPCCVPVSRCVSTTSRAASTRNGSTRTASRTTCWTRWRISRGYPRSPSWAASRATPRPPTGRRCGCPRAATGHRRATST
jgi:hypothetical protein